MEWRIVLVTMLLWAAAPNLLAVEQSVGGQEAVDRVLGYAGTWKVETESFDTPYSKAGHESKTLQNDCWKSGGYVACRQIVDGDAKVLIVFTCGGHDNTCTSYQIPPAGGAPGSGKLTMDGTTWTFPWTTASEGKTTWFRVVNVWSSSKTIEFSQEYSTDQTHWTKMSSGREVKVKEP